MPELYVFGKGKGKNYILRESKNVEKKTHTHALTHLPAPNNRPFNVHYALEWGYSLHGRSVSAMTRFMVWKHLFFVDYIYKFSLSFKRLH